MAVTFTHDDVTDRDGDRSPAAFLTLVEPDQSRPERYRSRDVHYVAGVQVDAVGPGQGYADQLLVHFVSGQGRRVATLALNEPGALAFASQLRDAFGRYGLDVCGPKPHQGATYRLPPGA
jgi:hypothetical protein